MDETTDGATGTVATTGLERGPGRGPGRSPGAAAGLVLAAVGALVIPTLWTVANGDAQPRLLVLDITLAVLGWAASPLLVWWPVAGSIGLTVLAALSPVATPPACLGALQVARRRRFPVAAAVAAGGVLAHAVQGWWRGADDGLPLLWWLALVGLGYGALLGWGAWAQARVALVCSLRERAERAEAEQGRRVVEARRLERTRIAREMHDVLAHRLSLLATYAGALEYRPDSSPEHLARAAGVVRASAHQALDELREVIGVLRDDADDGSGAGRPQPVLADLPRLVDESRAAGAQVEVVTQLAGADELPAVAGRTAYRIVQEALTNARRHAAGQPVRVALRGAPGAQVTIEICNPIVMPAVPVPRSAGGSGLVGLAERVQLAGGRLDHGAVDGEFRLRATLPWPA